METKILVVDDNEAARFLVANAFQGFDCEVVEAGDGLQGLAVATREKPSLIILDISMPIMDGGEMLSKLKAHPDLKTIPVIMLTGAASRENILKIAKLGVRDCIVKPFTEDVIIDKVSRILELKTKGEDNVPTKRLDDALKILVVDDKPAIMEQIRVGLATTTWTVEGVAQPTQALHSAKQNMPDAILISLSLPNEGGFKLFKMLHVSLKAKNIPIFALAVKTAAADHERAQQLGFAGIITKPIDLDHLKDQISSALKLDTSYKYFEQRDDVLVLRVPVDFTAQTATEISQYLSVKITATVDSGMDRFIVDLSQIEKADEVMLAFLQSLLKLCAELSVRCCFAGSPAIFQEKQELTKDWVFAASLDEAVTALNNKGKEMAA